MNRGLSDWLVTAPESSNPVTAQELLADMEAAWRAVSEAGGRPDMILIPLRRRVARRRGRRFVYWSYPHWFKELQKRAGAEQAA